MSLYRSEVWVAAPAWGAPPHPKNFINTLVFQKQELTSKLLTYFECPRDLVFVLISKFKLELHIIFLEQEAEILRFHLRTFLLKSVKFSEIFEEKRSELKIISVLQKTLA